MKLNLKFIVYLLLVLIANDAWGAVNTHIGNFGKADSLPSVVVPPQKRPVPIIVTSNEDSIKVDGKCTLREAIADANLLFRDTRDDFLYMVFYKDCAKGTDGEDAIQFDSSTDSSAFCLTRYSATEDDTAQYGDLDITSDITIEGNGSDKTVIDGGSGNSGQPTLCPAFSGEHERVFHVLPSGNLTLKKLTVKGGSAADTNLGGGILAEASLNLEDTIITNNVVQHEHAGGGIYITGVNTQLIINNSSIINNWGSGIYANSIKSLNIKKSFIDNDIGLDITDSPLVLESSTVSAYNFGIYAKGALTELNINTSTISSAWLGGLYLDGGKLTLTNTTIFKNKPGYEAEFASINFKNTYQSNSITNSTISDNEGVGIRCTDSTFALNNSTIAFTKAFHSSKNNVVYQDGIIGSNCIINIKSSIVTDDITTDEFIYHDDGFNFLKTDQSATDLDTFFKTFDTTPTDHGGLTATLALYSGNPAIGKGDCAVGSKDQRGEPRDNPCSIGAYEYTGAAPTCGDGHLDSSLGEICDDGNTTNNDGCSSTCTKEIICGDGNKEGTEECDNGSANNNSTADACRTTCQLAKCGDNTKDTGEECDDSTLTCNQSSCTLVEIPATCGDGNVDTDQGEECDNGSNNSNSTSDACRTTCQLPKCGDNIKDTSEECDGTNDCNDDCTKKSEVSGELTEEAVCGNNIVEDREECDDGNHSNADACSDLCKKIGPITSESSNPNSNSCSAGGILGFLPLFFGAGALKAFPLFKAL